MKNKWLAAALNILPGVGYLYLGVRTPFAVILLLLLPAIVIAGVFDPALSSSSSSDSSLSWGTLLILAIPAIAFIVDAFNEARAINQWPVPELPAVKPAGKATATNHVGPKPKAPAKSHESQLFLVGIPKFIVLSILTASLYNLYWNYQNWKLVKTHEGSHVSPFWRSVFSVLFIYSLLSKMQVILRSQDPDADLSAADRTVLYIVLSVVISVARPLWLLELLRPFILVGVQKRVNVGLGKEHMPSNRLTSGEWLILIFGVLIFILALIGQFALNGSTNV